jgi:tRNA dimethylallyltransferase
MVSNSKKALAVIGPTCTGKSDLALDLTNEFSGEIVNADSMQVYRRFDIGTAKPDRAARDRVPHHLIDVVEPSEPFNAALFKAMADRALADIWARDKIPVIVGGTGLYLRALIYDLFEVPKDMELREDLKRAYADNPLEMYEELKRIDPIYARKISHNDKIRVVRALEVYRLTGIEMSRWEAAHGFRDARYEVLKIGLTGDRAELYSRIDKRVDYMLDKGWVAEVRHILSTGCPEATKPFSGIGYREILSHLKGFICFEDMVKDIKKQTRRYAKRQFTWFSKEKDVCWFQYPQDSKLIKEKVAGFLEKWN